MFVKESDFIYKGYRCVVVFRDSLYRCGYVCIPQNNILYEKTQNDYLPVLKADLNGCPVGKRGSIPLFLFAFDDDERVRLDMYFDVHGSITYADDKVDFDGNGPWWIGFDCGHHGDELDIFSARRYWPNNERVEYRLKQTAEVHVGGAIRTQEYVEAECKSLVDQIEALVERVGA